jgi:hypothetical protein
MSVREPTVVREISESRLTFGSAQGLPMTRYGSHEYSDANSGSHALVRVADPARKVPVAVFRGVPRPLTVFGR